ncbi:MAG: nucleoside:proton symporter [Deltaproteobacteria bacterium]|nr:nucleoside:proton symporter [Deltaproteobacteria bacterium]
MILQPLLGILVLTGLAWAISEKRRKVSGRDLFTGLALQFAIALVLLRIPPVRDLFGLLNKAVILLEESTRAGTSFVFGYLGGAPLPFAEQTPGASYVFALQALPLVLVISALSSLLFYWRILPLFVRAFSWLLQKTMRIGGAVGLSAAANIFLGMVESPLFIRPYLEKMTRSELFVTMSCGMAGIAGTVMVLYASILKSVLPDALGHILVASVITIPAAIMLSRIMIPETEDPTAGRLVPPQEATGALDAITKGTMQGIELLFNIVAMLIVLIAVVHLVNGFLGWLPPFGGREITLQRLLGYGMAPIVWLIGIPWPEAQTAGALMGTKTVLNELIAYVDMAKLPPEALSPHSRLIMTYALCGFANLGSLGIMIGAMGAMAPKRRAEITGLGVKTIVSGTMATLMAGAVVGIIL